MVNLKTKRALKYGSLFSLVVMLLIVAALISPKSNAVSDLEIKTTIPLPGSGLVTDVAVDQDDGRVFAGQGRDVHVIDTATNAVVDTIVFTTADVPSGMTVIDLEVHPIEERLYVVFGSGGSSRQLTIDSETFAVMTVRESGTYGDFLRDVYIPRDASENYVVSADRGWLRVRASDDVDLGFVSPGSDNRTSYGTVSHDGSMVYGQKGNTVSGDTAYGFDTVTGSQFGSFTFGDAGGTMHYTDTPGGERVLLFVGDGSISQNAYVLNPLTMANVQTLGITGISQGSESVDGQSVIVTQNRNQSGGGSNSGLSLLKIQKGAAADWAQTDALELVGGSEQWAAGIDTAHSLGAYYVAGLQGENVFVVEDLAAPTLTPFVDIDSIPIAVGQHATAVDGSRVYVLGGYGGPENNDRDEVFFADVNPNGSFSAWTPTTALAFPNRDMGAAVAAGRVWMIGGSQDPKSVWSAEILATGHLGPWVAAPSVTGPNRDFPSVVSDGDRIYVIGGTNPSGSTDVRYTIANADGTIGGWQSTSSTIHLRANSVAEVVDGFIYVAGNYNSSNLVVERAEINPDGSLGTWTAVTSMGVMRSSSASAVVSDAIYISGGTISPNRTDQVEAAIAANDGSLSGWTAVSPMVTAVSEHTSFGLNGRVYIIGGVLIDGTKLDTVSCAARLVTAPCSVHANQPPVVDVTPDISAVEQGDLFEIEVNFADADSTSWSAVIAWGDGSADTVLPSISSPFFANHTFSAIAEGLEPTVTVTDDGGLSGEDSVLVDVVEPITEIVLFNDRDGDGIDPSDILDSPHKVQISGVGDFVSGDSLLEDELPENCRLRRNNVYGDWRTCDPANDDGDDDETLELEFATVEVVLYNGGDVVVESAASMSVERYLSAAVTLNDGTVLVAGGRTGSNTTLDSVEVFDPSTGTWTAKNPMNSRRYLHTLTLLNDGRVLASGGVDSSYLNSSEIYDPQTGVWTLSAGAMTTTRGIHSATLLQDGRVMVSGGHNGGVDITSTEIYDPATETWTSAGSTANNQGYHTSTLLPDGRVLLTGGTRSTTVYSDVAIWEDGVGWTAGAPMPIARGSHTATLLPDGRVLIAGGLTPGLVPSTDALIFDPTIQGWTQVASMSVGRYNLAASLIQDGRVVAIGGLASRTTAAGTDIVEAYDPGTDSWVVLGSLSEPKGHLGINAQLPNGDVLIGGGRDAGTIRSSVDLISFEISESDKLASPHKVQVSNVGNFTTGDEFHVPPTADITFRLRRNNVYGDWNAPNGGDPINFPAGETVWELEFATVEVVLYNDRDGDGIDESDKLASPHKVQVSNVGDFVTGDEFHVPPTADITFRLRRNNVYGDWNAPNGGAPINFPAGETVWELEFATVEVVLYNDRDGDGIDESDKLASPHKVQVSNVGDFVTGDEFHVPPTADITFRLRRNNVYGDWNAPNGGAPINFPAGDTVWELEFATVEVVLYNGGEATVESVDSMSVERFLAAAATLDDGRVLVAGGRNSSGVTLASAEIFDPSDNTWTTVSSMNTPRSRHGLTTLMDGRVLASAGVNGGYLSSSEIYDPDTDTWTPAASLTTTRGFHSVTLLLDGRVMASGGHNGSVDITSTEIYDPVADTWTSAGSTVNNQGAHTSTLLLDGRVLLTGGTRSTTQYADVAVWEDGVGWTPMASMPVGRGSHAAALLPDGRVLVTGGNTPGLIPSSDALIFDPSTQVWTQVSSMSTVRYHHEMAILSDGKIAAIGGLDEYSTAAGTDVVELYDVTADTWTVIGSLSDPKGYTQVSAQLQDGRILVSGGSDVSTIHSTADLIGSGITEDDKLYAPHKVQVSNVGDFTTGDEFHVPPTANITFRLRRNNVYGDWNAPNGGDPINLPTGETTWELEFATVEVLLFNDEEGDGIDEADKLFDPHRVQVSNVGDYTTGDEFHVPPSADITFRLRTGNVYGPWNEANAGDPINFPAGDTVWELEFATVTFTFDLPADLLDEFDTQVSGVATVDNGGTVHLPPGAEINFRVINGSWTDEWVTHAFGAGECQVEWDLVNGVTYTGTGCLPD